MVGTMRWVGARHWRNAAYTLELEGETRGARLRGSWQHANRGLWMGKAVRKVEARHRRRRLRWGQKEDCVRVSEEGSTHRHACMQWGEGMEARTRTFALHAWQGLGRATHPYSHLAQARGRQCQELLGWAGHQTLGSQQAQHPLRVSIHITKAK